jgi:hypothetical protein
MSLQNRPNTKSRYSVKLARRFRWTHGLKYIAHSIVVIPQCYHTIHFLHPYFEYTAPSQTTSSLRNLVHPHIMRTKLCRNTRTSTARIGENFCPLPVSLTKTWNVLEVDRQRSRSISSNQTHNNTVTQGPGPVRIQLAIHWRGTASWTKVARRFTERVLVDSKKSL